MCARFVRKTLGRRGEELAITHLERGIFLSLFNRGGYVLDFSTNDFDNFTLMSIGLALCDHYRESKGKSLTAYLNECTDAEALKLLNDLMDYYELHYEDEFTQPEESAVRSYSFNRYSKEFARYYRKARAVLDRENAGHNPFEGSSEYLKEQFSSEYMATQIDSLMKMRETNPTDAIGRAKELVESYRKTILKETGVEVSNDWDMNELIKATKKKLDIDTESVSNNLPEAKTVKKILGSLTGLVGGIAEFRNGWGMGTEKRLTSNRSLYATPSLRLGPASLSSSISGTHICGERLMENCVDNPICPELYFEL